MTTASGDRAMPAGIVIPVFACLIAFGPLTIDLVLPFLPGVARDLSVSTGTAQLVVTGATYGFAIGQLAAGPLSDAVGRRRPLAVAVVVHVLASVVAATAADMTLLVAARFAQGAACTAAGVVVIAIVRDLYAGKRLVTMLANLGVVASVTPLLVPAIGAQLTRLIDWRGSFVVVAVFGTLATAAALVFIPETLPAERRRPGIAVSLRHSVGLLRQPRLLALASASAAGWSIGFGYLATAPFLYTSVYGVDPNLYGALFLMTSIVTFSVAQTSGRVLIPRWGGRRVLMVGGIVAAGGAAAVGAAALVGADALPVVVATIALALAGRAVSTPAVQFLSLQGPANQAGSVTALLGAVSFLVAGTVAPIVGGFATVSLLPFAALVLVCAVVLFAVSFLQERGLPSPSATP